MKNNRCKKGFTLIELLVVVLIIGILAAIALPQYQKAVAKARGAELISMVRAIDTAQQAYFLANNTWANNFDLLDVTFDSLTRLSEAEAHSYSVSDAYFKNQESILAVNIILKTRKVYWQSITAVYLWLCLLPGRMRMPVLVCGHIPRLIRPLATVPVLKEIPCIVWNLNRFLPDFAKNCNTVHTLERVTV